MDAGSKDQLDHSAFWLSKIWRKCYKVARAGPYTTTILELSIFISFLIVSFHTYMLYALCFILLWIWDVPWKEQLLPLETAIANCDRQTRTVLLNLLETFDFPFVLPVILLALFFPYPDDAAAETRTRDPELAYEWECDDYNDDDEKTCVHFCFLFHDSIYLLNGDLIRLAFAFLCTFLESQTTFFNVDMGNWPIFNSEHDDDENFRFSLRNPTSRFVSCSWKMWWGLVVEEILGRLVGKRHGRDIRFRVTTVWRLANTGRPGRLEINLSASNDGLMNKREN
jgi:hypothetical protein